MILDMYQVNVIDFEYIIEVFCKRILKHRNTNLTVMKRIRKYFLVIKKKRLEIDKKGSTFAPR